MVFGRLAGLEPFVVAIGTVGLGALFEAIGLMIWGPSTISMPQLFSIRLYHIYGSAGVKRGRHPHHRRQPRGPQARTRRAG